LLRCRRQQTEIILHSPSAVKSPTRTKKPTRKVLTSARTEGHLCLDCASPLLPFRLFDLSVVDGRNPLTTSAIVAHISVFVKSKNHSSLSRPSAASRLV
jgi:hypothetical protein